RDGLLGATRDRGVTMKETLTLIEKTAILKTTEVLRPVPTAVLAQLDARGRETHYDAGETIFREGEPSTGVYLIVDGMVEVRKGRALDAMRHAGDGFGEIGLNEGEPHQFTARAATHTHVLSVSNEDFSETVLDYPEVGLGMLRGFGRRMAEMAQRIHHLEGQVAHLSAALNSAGVQAPLYQSGAYPRPAL